MWTFTFFYSPNKNQPLTLLPPNLNSSVNIGIVAAGKCWQSNLMIRLQSRMEPNSIIHVVIRNVINRTTQSIVASPTKKVPNFSWLLKVKYFAYFKKINRKKQTFLHQNIKQHKWSHITSFSCNYITKHKYCVTYYLNLQLKQISYEL